MKVRPAIALALLLAPPPAWAHDALGRAGGFAAGFGHPFAGLDHLLAMVAVGLWGAFLGRPLVTALPVIFPGLMALGALAALAGLPPPPVEAAIALSVLALGAAVGLGLKAPVWAACAIVGAFGFCHGYAHGRELPSSADPGAYCAGFVLATGLLHAAGIALGAVRTLHWGDGLLRLAGAAIAVGGVLFLRAAL